MSHSITEVTTNLYELLEPLESNERKRALIAVLALLDEKFDLPNLRPAILGESEKRKDAANPPESLGLGENASKWMLQNQVERDSLDQIFHIDGSKTELIISDVPGKSLREKTFNCYLLIGIRNLISTDDPYFTDKEALEFCHLTDSYDKNNHTSNRRSLDNRVSGDRTSGFRLTVPGLRDSAKLIREMTNDA